MSIENAYNLLMFASCLPIAMTGRVFIDTNIVTYAHISNEAGIRLLGLDVMKEGVKAKDALHIACAIIGKCDFFITTDNKLTKKTLSDPVRVALCNFTLSLGSVLLSSEMSTPVAYGVCNLISVMMAKRAQDKYKGSSSFKVNTCLFVFQRLTVNNL